MTSDFLWLLVHIPKEEHETWSEEMSHKKYCPLKVVDSSIPFGIEHLECAMVYMQP